MPHPAPTTPVGRCDSTSWPRPTPSASHGPDPGVVDAETHRTGVLVLKVGSRLVLRFAIVSTVVAPVLAMYVVWGVLGGHNDLEPLLGTVGSTLVILLVTMAPGLLLLRYAVRVRTRFDADGIHATYMFGTRHLA